jgi:outer membrane receptor for ferrienterochelin and colicins
MTKHILSLLLLVGISMTAQVKNDSIPNENDAEELEEITVQSTRTSRTIQNTPTRIETIDAEELEEKGNMKPANVSMVLHESTGLLVQQTSATSGNASIRVQGLDGRYTQLLKDGYPNFGNFASGLSILEIPPLDLKQVEVIKGPASTLYGGGAIAGVVNFISKTPTDKGEFNFIFNQSNIGQTNLGGYISRKNGKFMRF